MATDFYIKQDDRLPEIESILKDADDTVINLSGATVKFIMTSKLADIGSTPKVEADATVVDAVTGHVKYAWIAADTDTAGVYRAEWEVQFADTRLETFPNDSYLEVKVTGDLGGVS